MSDVLYELGAETWVRFGSNGIGFLNHKNNYNPKSCMGNWQEARTVATLDKEAPGHVGFKGTSTLRADYGPDSVDHSKSKHFTTAHPPEAEGQLNVAAWPRSKDSLFANGDENERYLVSSTDLMYGHAAGYLRAHDTLWAQSTIKNREVPVSVAPRTSLLEAKKKEWAAQADMSYSISSHEHYVSYPEHKKQPVAVKTRSFCASFDKPHVRANLRKDLDF